MSIQWGNTVSTSRKPRKRRKVIQLPTTSKMASMATTDANHPADPAAADDGAGEKVKEKR